MFQLTGSKRALGVDIGGSSVKVVELSRGGHGYTVENCAIQKLPGEAMDGQIVRRPDIVGDAIKAAIKSTGIRLRAAYTCVPSSTVIVRTVSMPAEFGDGEIETNLQLDAAQYIPFPMEEVYLDFHALPETFDQQTGMRDVILVASRRDNVDRRTEALAAGGVKAIGVDVEGYALAESFRMARADLNGRLELDDVNKPLAIVDVGESVMTLYALRDGEIIFTREQAFGGGRLRVEVGDGRQQENGEENPAAVVVEKKAKRFREQLAEQVNQALQFYYNASHYGTGGVQEVAGIVLFGGTGRVKGVADCLSDAMNMPAVVANPFAGLRFSKRARRSPFLGEAARMSVACGLAARGMSS